MPKSCERLIPIDTLTSPGVNWHTSGSRVPDLDPRAIHVWRVFLDPGAAAGTLQSRRELLSPDEIARADRYASGALRDRFVLRRGAVRIILGRYTGRHPADIHFDYGPHGKPVLQADAVRRSRLEFNLTHSGDWALLGIARRRRIGIDIERVHPLPDADRIAARFFSPVECAHYRSLPPARRPLAFFRCWTRKEAFVKALGTGLSLPLDTFDVTLSPDEPARILRMDGRLGDPARWSLLSFEPTRGYAAAVATAGIEAALSFFNFSSEAAAGWTVRFGGR